MDRLAVRHHRRHVAAVQFPGFAADGRRQGERVHPPRQRFRLRRRREAQRAGRRRTGAPGARPERRWRSAQRRGPAAGATGPGRPAASPAARGRAAPSSRRSAGSAPALRRAEPRTAPCAPSAPGGRPNSDSEGATSIPAAATRAPRRICAWSWRSPYTPSGLSQPFEVGGLRPGVVGSVRQAGPHIQDARPPAALKPEPAPFQRLPGIGRRRKGGRRRHSEMEIAAEPRSDAQRHAAHRSPRHPCVRGERARLDALAAVRWLDRGARTARLHHVERVESEHQQGEQPSLPRSGNGDPCGLCASRRARQPQARPLPVSVHRVERPPSGRSATPRPG